MASFLFLYEYLFSKLDIQLVLTFMIHPSTSIGTKDSSPTNCNWQLKGHTPSYYVWPIQSRRFWPATTGRRHGKNMEKWHSWIDDWHGTCLAILWEQDVGRFNIPVHNANLYPRSRGVRIYSNVVVRCSKYCLTNTLESFCCLECIYAQNSYCLRKKKKTYPTQAALASWRSARPGEWNAPQF